MVRRIWKISKKITSIGWKMLEIFLALVFVLGGLVLYRLHNEPVDAMKYFPEIEQALFSSDSGYHLEAEKVELTSDLSREGLIQIDIENLKVLRGDNSVLFSVPSAYFAYDIWHILTLNYLPSTIDIEKPFFEMIIDEKGTMLVKAQETEAHTLNIASFKDILKRILAIRDLNVRDAHFRLQDNRHHQQWDLQEANLDLDRYFHFSNTAKLNASLIGNGVHSRLLATAKFNRWTRSLSLEAGLDEINLQKISTFIPVLQEADLTVQLSTKAEFDIKKSHQKITDYISKVQFNAKTLKAGTLNLMDDLDNVYYVESADINGSLGMGAKALKIASSKIQLKDEKPVDFYLDVVGVDTFLNTGDSVSLKTTLKATLYDVPTEHVPALWPSQQGPDAHAWVKQNLSQGKLTQADFTLYFAGDELVDLLGDIHAKGVHVDYLSPMKPVDNVDAQVLLYPDKVHILVDKGTIDELVLNKADLLFTDVDKDESWLQIDLDVSGPVTQALELISSKPLEFPQMFDLKPSMISGVAKTRVHLSFPLLDDISTKDVQAVVHADITKAKVNEPLEKWDLKEGTLTLDVTNEGMEIAGDIKMKNSPLNLKWHEYFDSQKITSEYAVSGTLMASDMGVLLPDLKSFITGKMNVQFQGTKNLSEAYSGELKVDGRQAWVDIAPLGVQKKSDSPMEATLSFSDTTAQTGHLNWQVKGALLGKGEDLKLQGQANWAPEKLHILLTEVLAGINQFQGELQNTKNDFSLILKGQNWQAYDLGKVLKLLPKSESTGKIQNITLDIALDELALNKIKPFSDVSLMGKRQGALWQSFHLQGQAKDPFVVAYNPQKLQFLGSFADLGDLLDRLDFGGRFLGGRVSLTADQTKSGHINGKIRAENATLKETGFLMQAMTILGIVDAFRGKDMEFDDIEIPFTLTPDFQLDLEDAYAVGTNLGITLKGTISMDEVNLSGSVVPAYAINSLPGKIPLVGWLFRDSTGGGLINVPFTITGPLSDSEIHWNALKTVAPGVLGRLF